MLINYKHTWKFTEAQGHYVIHFHLSNKAYRSSQHHRASDSSTQTGRAKRKASEANNWKDLSVNLHLILVTFGKFPKFSEPHSASSSVKGI